MADTLVNELISQRGNDAAREAVMGITDPQFQTGMARELAQRLARETAPDAAAWAFSLPAGDTRGRAVAEVIQEWADTDAVAAGQYLQQLGTSPEFDRARQDYAMRTVKTDPEGALAWVQAISDDQARQNATQEVLNSWARRDQNAAQAWAANNGMQVTQTGRGGFGGGPGGGGPPGGGRGRR